MVSQNIADEQAAEARRIREERDRQELARGENPVLEQRLLAQEREREAAQRETTQRQTLTDEARTARERFAAIVARDIARTGATDLASEKLEAERIAKAERDRAAREEFQRRSLNSIVARERTKSGATDAASGLQIISRSEFNRIQNSPVAAREIERTREFQELKAKTAAAKIIDNRERDRQLDVAQKRARLDALQDKLESQRNRKGFQLREAANVAGDLGLSFVPIVGTIRDAKEVFKNWDEMSTGQRFTNGGLLALSAVGDATFVFGVGAGIKTGVAAARGSQKIATTTASVARASDARAFVRAAESSKASINRIEVVSAPDPKFIDEVRKTVTSLPTKRYDVIIEPTQTSVRTGTRLAETIDKAAPIRQAGRFKEPPRSRFVIEVDRNVDTKKITDTVRRLPDGDGREIVVRSIDRGLSDKAVDDLAEAVAAARSTFSKGKSFDSLKAEAKAGFKNVTDPKNTVNPARANRQFEKQLRVKNYKVKTEKISFKADDAKNVRTVERNIRLEPEPPRPPRLSGSGGRGDGGRGGVATRERTRTQEQRTGSPATRRTTTTRRTSAVSRKRTPVGVPVPGSGDKASPTEVPERTPGRQPEPSSDPSARPDPDILVIDDPQINFDPRPDPRPDPTPSPNVDPIPDPSKVPDPTSTVTRTPRGKGKAKKSVIVKLPPDAKDKDGNPLFPRILNFKQGLSFVSVDLKTGQRRQTKRIPKGGVESGVTPRETLKVVGFDKEQSGKKRVKVGKFDAIVSGRDRIRFERRKGKLNS